MVRFVCFLRFLGHKIHNLAYINIQICTNMSNYHIFDNNLVSFKNIDVWPRYGSKTVIFTTRSHIWAYVFGHISAIFHPISYFKRSLNSGEQYLSDKHEKYESFFDFSYFGAKNGRGRQGGTKRSVALKFIRKVGSLV